MTEKTNEGASYGALGNWFEYLNDDCDYEIWSQYLVEKLKELKAGARGLDIGCGNGYFTRALYKAGYDMTGIDISPSMLSVARERAAKEGARCEFLLGDITKLKICGRADFAVAVNDCLNYVPEEALIKAFTRVYSCLNRGGAFVFDVSTPYKLREVYANNLFSEDRGDLCWIWYNTQTEKGVVMDITLFVRGADGKYSRYDERHEQFAHGREHIISALKEAGFSSVRTEGHLGGDDSQRINFIAVK